MNKKIFKKLLRYSKNNKKRDVFAEKIYRKALSEKGYSHKRQIIIGKYIVDFTFPSRNLIIEIDGWYHQSPKVVKYDNKREEEIKNFGFNFVRFSDNEIINDLEDCVNCIDDFCENEDILKKFNDNIYKANGMCMKKVKKNEIKEFRNKKTIEFNCKLRYEKFRKKSLYTLPR